MAEALQSADLIGHAPVLDHLSVRDGLGEDDAAAISWTLASPEVHRLLRAERDWTAERYLAWLEDTLKATLLPM